MLRRCPRCLPLLVGFALCLLVFSPALTGTYTSDGRVFIERLGGLPDRALAALVQPGEFAPTTGILSWRPLTALTMMLVDVRLFHGTSWLSTIFSLAWHAANAALIFALIRRLRPERPAGAWLAAFFFLLHPLATEATLCMGFRADVMAATAVLGCLLLALRWQAQRRPSWLLALAGVFAAGLLTKEITAVALLLVPALLVSTAAPPASRWRDGLVALATLLVPLALFAVLWVRFRWVDYPARFLGGDGRLLGMANALTVWHEEYFARLLWPWPLRNNIPFEPLTRFADPRLLAAGAALALLGVMVLLARNRLASLGGLFYLLAFLPVAQLTPVPDPVAERFCYVPQIGAALLFLGLFERLAGARGRWIWACGAALLVALAGVSLRRAGDWRDDLTLNIANWENAGDTRVQALENLGGLYLLQAEQLQRAGRAAAAADALSRARENLEALLRDDPRNARGHRLYAVWAWGSGRQDLARREARLALQLAPADPQMRATAQRLGALAETPGAAP